MREWFIVVTPYVINIIFFPFNDILILIIPVSRQSSHTVWVVLGTNKMISFFYNRFIYFFAHSVLPPHEYQL